jgi:2'-5' RNA ligase
VVESAVILTVPHVEARIADLRLRYDPAAAVGVPAHVTLIYPFAPPPVSQAHLDALVTLFAGVPTMELNFVGTGRFAQTVYLRVDDDEPLRRMIASLAARWPEYPPYGGRFSAIVPHLTVADRQSDPRVLDEVEALLQDKVPLSARVREATLLVSNDQGFWTPQCTFPLAVR